MVALKSFGHLTYEKDLTVPHHAPFAGNGDLDVPVTPATLFDIASLTKPVATTTMAAILYERGLLELDAPVIGTLPEFLADDCGALDPRRHDVTFRMLLAHSSGLPAYEKLFLRARSRDELLFAALTTSLSADPGTRAEYSDIGFIILGAALERIAEESLDAFCQREIFGPLALTNTTFDPPVNIRHHIPPTADEREDDEREDWESGAGAAAREAAAAQPISNQSPRPRSAFRKRIIQGEVQDENASVMGGVAGHAGLFSSSEDLAHFAHEILQYDCHFKGGRANEMTSRQILPSPNAISKPILRPETVALFTRRESAPAGTTRTLGWDTPSAPSQSGRRFGPRSFGHLGYTGTSLWIDPDRQLSITLLTNRTWPDCSNQAIKQTRPKFHDAVIEALDNFA